jgi:hypothetical protein
MSQACGGRVALAPIDERLRDVFPVEREHLYAGR